MIINHVTEFQFQFQFSLFSDAMLDIKPRNILTRKHKHIMLMKTSNRCRWLWRDQKVFESNSHLCRTYTKIIFRYKTAKHDVNEFNWVANKAI